MVPGEMLNNIINGNIYNDVGGFTRFMLYKSISFLSTNHNTLFSTLFLKASHEEIIFYSAFKFTFKRSIYGHLLKLILSSLFAEYQVLSERKLINKV